MGGSVDSGEGDVGFQIAPMVDVVFVIMLFFMASVGSMVTERELSMTLPGEARATTGRAPAAPQIIFIRGDENVIMQDRIYDSPASEDLPALVTRLREIVARHPDTPVIIQPEPNTRHQRIINVLNAATVAGVQNLTFM
ncbi:MAG: ExbD/TolR family protein [Verrucomicrobiales bacterium]